MVLFVQGMIFGAMLITGLVLGLWVDFYRFVGIKFPPFNHILDLAFWAVITAVVFAVLFAVNHLELRLYVFFSLGLGLALYFWLLSKYVLRLYSWLLRLTVCLGKWLWRKIIPLVRLLQWVSGGLDNIVTMGLSGLMCLYLKSGQHIKRWQEKGPPT